MTSWSPWPPVCRHPTFPWRGFRTEVVSFLLAKIPSAISTLSVVDALIISQLVCGFQRTTFVFRPTSHEAENKTSSRSRACFYDHQEWLVSAITQRSPRTKSSRTSLIFVKYVETMYVQIVYQRVGKKKRPTSATYRAGGVQPNINPNWGLAASVAARVNHRGFAAVGPDFSELKLSASRNHPWT